MATPTLTTSAELGADPITQVYQAIFAALNSAAGFASLVKIKNQNDLSDKSWEIRVFKPELQPADVPEVTLYQGNYSLKPFGTNSRISSISQSFDVVTATTNIRIVRVNAVKWQAMIALGRAGDNIGVPWVRTWDITGGSDSDRFTIPRRSAATNSPSLSSMFRINVVMDIPRTLLMTG